MTSEFDVTDVLQDGTNTVAHMVDQTEMDTGCLYTGVYHIQPSAIHLEPMYILLSTVEMRKHQNLF